MQFYGRLTYEQEILEVIKKMFETYSIESLEVVEIHKEWLGELLQSGYCISEGKLQEKQSYGKKEMEGYFHALTDPDNISMFGMGMFLKSASVLNEAELLKSNEYIKKILATYDEWKKRFVERIWNGIGKNGVLKGKGKVELAAFCKYVLDN